MSDETSRRKSDPRGDKIKLRKGGGAENLLPNEPKCVSSPEKNMYLYCNQDHILYRKVRNGNRKKSL